MTPDFDLVVEKLDVIQRQLLSTALRDGKATRLLLGQRGEVIRELEQLVGAHPCSPEQLARLVRIHSDGQLLWVRLSASRKALGKELQSLARDSQLVSSLLGGVKPPPNLDWEG
jgi:hypothetical protein